MRYFSAVLLIALALIFAPSCGDDGGGGTNPEPEPGHELIGEWEFLGTYYTPLDTLYLNDIEWRWRIRPDGTATRYTDVAEQYTWESSTDTTVTFSNEGGDFFQTVYHIAGDTLKWWDQLYDSDNLYYYLRSD